MPARGGERQDGDPGCGHRLHQRERRQPQRGHVHQPARGLGCERGEPAPVPEQQLRRPEGAARRQRRQRRRHVVLERVSGVRDQRRGECDRKPDPYRRHHTWGGVSLPHPAPVRLSSAAVITTVTARPRGRGVRAARKAIMADLHRKRPAGRAVPVRPSPGRHSSLLLPWRPPNGADGWSKCQPQCDRHHHRGHVPEWLDADIGSDDASEDHQQPCTHEEQRPGRRRAWRTRP